MELQDYEQRRGEDRQLYVKISCLVCKTEKWVRWNRVRDGQGLYCSLACANVAQKKGKDRKYVGKENGKMTLDKAKNLYSVYWFDPETLQRKTTSYARWYWEVHNGEIPEGYRASYKDGDGMNIDPSNIILISPEEFGKSVSDRLMGHTFSEETLQKMSDAKKGKPLSETHKQHIGEQTRRMWDEGVFDAPEIREVYSRQGKSTLGSKRTDEQRKKMSNSHIGIPAPANSMTPEAKEKRRQKLLGRKQTPESNRKRSVSQKGKEFTDEHLEKLSVSGRNRTDNRGEHSIWWKGGIAYQPYPEEFSDYLKKKIRRRDHHKCQSCGENVYRSKRGHIHHINGDKQNCSPDNLMLLCATCHNAVHSRNTITSKKIEELKSKLYK